MRFILALSAALVWLTGAAWACPGYTDTGATYHLTGDQLYTAQRYEVRAGGEFSVADCNISPGNDRVQGFVTQPPDFSFHLSGMDDYRLVLSTVSDCDTILLVTSGTMGWCYETTTTRKARSMP